MPKPAFAGALLALSLLSPAHAGQAVSLDFLQGRWNILDASGNRLGTSEIAIQASEAMLFETRTITGRPPQPLWLANTESDGGWIQLFVAVNGRLREFRTRSPAGEWPLVLGAHVGTADGAEVDYRMTIAAPSRDRSHRLLEVSRDGGATWTDVLDYRYVRAAGETGSADTGP